MLFAQSSKLIVDWWYADGVFSIKPKTNRFTISHSQNLQRTFFFRENTNLKQPQTLNGSKEKTSKTAWIQPDFPGSSPPFLRAFLSGHLSAKTLLLKWIRASIGGFWSCKAFLSSTKKRQQPESLGLVIFGRIWHRFLVILSYFFLDSWKFHLYWQRHLEVVS